MGTGSEQVTLVWQFVCVALGAGVWIVLFIFTVGDGELFDS